MAGMFSDHGHGAGIGLLAATDGVGNRWIECRWIVAGSTPLNWL